MIIFFEMWRLWQSGLAQATVQRGLRRLGLVALVVAGVAMSGCGGGSGLRGPAVDAPTAGPLAGAIALGIRTAGGLRGLMVSLLVEVREEGNGPGRFALERARGPSLPDDPLRITLFTFHPGAAPAAPPRPPRPSATGLLAMQAADLPAVPRMRPAASVHAGPPQRTASALDAMDREIIMR